jgi:RND family efflux transporter MFP subunit
VRAQPFCRVRTRDVMPIEERDSEAARASHPPQSPYPAVMRAHPSESELRPPPPLAKRLAVLLGVLALVGLGLALAGRIQEAQGEQTRLAAARTEAAEVAGRAPEVAVVLPASATYTPLVVLQGSLEPVQAADLGFEVAGRVARVDVELGEHVRAGDVLVALDRATLGAQSAQSDAAISVAQANVDMLRDRVTLLEQLTRSGAAPERDLTTARQQLAVAEAQLGQAQAGRRSIATSAADHILRAPFAGVVTRVPSGVGAVSGPGQTLVRVEDLTTLRLRTTVSQSELEALAVGATASLEGHEGVSGTISSAVRSLDPQSRRAPVEVVVPNPGERLVANAVVRARVVVGTAQSALRIPGTARRPNGTVLVVGADNRVEARAVVGQSDLDGSWLISDGLAREDRVVVRPAAAREGQIVMPVEARAEDTTPAQAAL